MSYLHILPAYKFNWSGMISDSDIYVFNIWLRLEEFDLLIYFMNISCQKSNKFNFDYTILELIQQTNSPIPPTVGLCGGFAIWVSQKHKSPHNQGHIICQNPLITHRLNPTQQGGINLLVCIYK